MRNLSLFRNFSGRHRDLASFCDCIMFCDSATWKNTFLCTANDSGIIHIFDTDLDEKFNVACVIDLKEIESIEWLDTTSVVKLQQVFSTLYVMLNSGIFIVVPLPYTCRKELRIIDSGLDCVCQVSWSRDCERTVVIDEASFVSVICVVNDECEKLMGFSLQDVEEEENKLVNLGWGSVETQFRGSEVSSFETERKTRIACMDDTVEIVWKNNSSIFAINYMCRREGTRKLKIFDQNGVLLNIAKDIYGLSAAVDWCCSKNLIFMVQKLKDKTVACFLEENGLRHGEFRLPDDFIVKNLLWNSDGTILATMGMLSRSNRTHVVFLWTTSNYKWYAKYKLTFEKRVLHLQWDDVTPNRLHLILDSGVYRMFEWFFDTTESTEFLTNGQDSKFVVSVDGATVGFTRYGGLFPPISVSECACKFPSSINAFVFAANALRPAAAKAMAVVDRVSTACENDMFAESLSVSALLYLSDNSIFLCDTFQRLTEPREKMDVNGKRSFRLVLPRMRNGNDYKLIRFETAAEITAWLWLAECKRVYFCWTRLDGYYFCVCDFCFASARCVVRKSVKVDSRILITKNYGREVIVYLESGAVLVYKDDKLYSSSLILKEPCFRVEIANSKTMIALSVNRNLYVNEQIKWRDIRSFRWRRPFLVAVTSSHRLVIAKVKKNKFCDILSRLIEPKSHLVTIVGDRVLLEADRGNLELITPRPFVSFKMTLELLRRNYLNVFKLLKKQRVNLNVVFDHDPNAFTKNAALICETLTVDPSYLTLFVMELENSNVACRVFPWKYRERSEHHRRDYEDDDDEDDDGGGVVFVNKVGVVCDVLFAALKAAQSPNLILPTIAVLVRLGRLAEAAKYACENGEISFLFQLTDSRLVYEATLASYDLSCALKIAEFSKMDPCDYLPFIQKLQTLSKTMMRFTVNDRLGKTTKALKYLSASEEDVHFEECLRYVEKYRLYAEAFEIFAEHLKLAELRDGDQTTRKIHTRYMRIASSFGQHLLREKCFEDAAVVFEKARMYEKALECHSSSGNWHAAVSLIQSMHLNESMSTEWYRRLHTSLISKQRYEEAALVAFLLMKNASLATENYLLAHRYTKAVESANSFGSIPLILPSLKCSLLDETKTYSKEFHTRTTLLKRYTQRLKRINDEMNSRQDTIVSEEIDRFSYGESYASSESASSRSSTSTRLSSSSGSVSAKKLRRRERRLWNLKPGNPREKHSLMNAIRELIHDSDAKFSHAVPELTNALLHLEEYNVARNLHAEFVTYSQFVQRIISNLWKADSLDEEGGFLDISLKCPPLWSTYPNKSKLLNIDPIL